MTDLRSQLFRQLSNIQSVRLDHIRRKTVELVSKVENHRFNANSAQIRHYRLEVESLIEEVKNLDPTNCPESEYLKNNIMISLEILNRKLLWYKSIFGDEKKKIKKNRSKGQSDVNKSSNREYHRSKSDSEDPDDSELEQLALTQGILEEQVILSNQVINSLSKSSASFEDTHKIMNKVISDIDESKKSMKIMERQRLKTQFALNLTFIAFFIVCVAIFYRRYKIHRILRLLIEMTKRFKQFIYK
ncbi:MAG: hypothetical protein MHMPM18_002375 [Marteilia pararefringens]